MDGINGEVLGIEQGKGLEGISNFFKRMTIEQREAVRVVSIDRGNAFQSAVLTYLPKAAITFERHCTLHFLVASGQAEQYSPLLRGHSAPPPQPAPEPNKKKKEIFKKTKRLKKKRKALPHLPLPNSYQPPSSPCTWEEKQEYLYELFLTGDSPACLFDDYLDAHKCPTLAKLVNYPTQH